MSNISEDYKLAEFSYSPIKGENWERIAKFAITNVAVSYVVAILILTVCALFDQNKTLAVSILVIILISGQSFLLSWYEEWRGCYFKKSTSNNTVKNEN